MSGGGVIVIILDPTKTLTRALTVGMNRDN